MILRRLFLPLELPGVTGLWGASSRRPGMWGPGDTQEKEKMQFPDWVSLSIIGGLIHKDCPSHFQDALTQNFRKGPAWVFPSSSPRETEKNPDPSWGFSMVEPSSPGEESEDWGQKPHHEKWAFADWCPVASPSVWETAFHSLPTYSYLFFWSQFILCHLLWPHNLGQLFLLFGPMAVWHCSIRVLSPWDCYLLLRYPWLSDRARVMCCLHYTLKYSVKFFQWGDPKHRAVERKWLWKQGSTGNMIDIWNPSLISRHWPTITLLQHVPVSYFHNNAV